MPWNIHVQKRFTGIIIAATVAVTVAPAMTAVALAQFVHTAKRNDPVFKVSLTNYKDKLIMTNKSLRDYMLLKLLSCGLENNKTSFGSASNFNMTQVFTVLCHSVLC